MALIQIGFFSEVLGMCTRCSVVLPQLPDADLPAREFPTVYLLHGFRHSASSWVRMTSIERYALAHGAAVVMPEVHLSCYADMVHGGKFFTYVADELPKIMAGFFPLSPRRENTFLCGASMGGYGALKIAARRPERFAAAGSLSAGHRSFRAAIDLPDARGIRPGVLAFGENGPDAEDDETADCFRALANTADAPRIFIACGTEDELLLPQCRQSRDFFRSFPGNPFGFEYAECPGGHNWSFWDGHVRDFLRFARLKTDLTLR